MRKKIIYMFFLFLSIILLPSKGSAIDWQEIKTMNEGYFFIRYDADSVTDCGDYFTVWCIYGFPQEEMKKFSTAGKQAVALQTKFALKKTSCVVQSLIEEVIYSDWSFMRMGERKKPIESYWVEFGPGVAFYSLWETTKQKLVQK